jgi:hypothetical protein
LFFAIDKTDAGLIGVLGAKPSLVYLPIERMRPSLCPHLVKHNFRLYLLALLSVLIEWSKLRLTNSFSTPLVRNSSSMVMSRMRKDRNL